MDFTREYLERLATIETPAKVPEGLYVEDYDETLPSDKVEFEFDYNELRYHAKALLENPNAEDKRLTQLVLKLGLDDLEI